MYRLLWWLHHHVLTPAVRALAAMGRIHVGVQECDPFSRYTGLRSTPPPGHPERVRPDMPPTPLERRLEYDMSHGWWPTLLRGSRSAGARPDGRPPASPGAE